MKHISVVMVFAISLLLSAFATAQTASQNGVKANIPFAFIAGEKTLPPGEYQISCSGSFLVHLDNRSAANAQTWLAVLPGDSPRSETGKLVFHKYGDRYFLYKAIGPAPLNMNAVVPTSDYEVSVRVIAGNPVPETVYLALRK